MKYISYINFLIGVTVVAIWSIQEISNFNILEKPMAGASIFLILAFLLNVLSQRKSAV